ncbi:MAG: septum formation protein Maf [Bacteroidetes bacterium]|jgi:septum formation protein|nr:MAG: septum formation protein Maf [Bacteroidota bacterium]
MIQQLLARKAKKLVLGSQSPRRKAFLESLHLTFSTRSSSVEESYPPDLVAEEIAIYLAELKFEALEQTLKEDELLITSDTVVWNNNTSLEKAANKEDAIRMLKALSNNKHQVITALCIGDSNKRWTSYEVTEVHFRELKEEEIEYYVEHYQPFDKAGAYGIQEWIGLIGITHISGNYPAVVGLPTALLYQGLIEFLED